MDQHVYSNIPQDHQLSTSTSVPPFTKRSHWLRWVVILLFLLFFVWAFRHRAKKQAALAGNGPAAGPVAVTSATAWLGNMRIYLNAIGTVTPVYTDSMTAQVTGVITAVHYREGQLVHKGDPLVDIDPEPYAAQLLAAQGLLERDQNVLAEARMDLDRYRGAWAHNAISRQQLEDQEKLVLQDQGTVKNDQGTVHYDEVQLRFCHIVAPISGRVGLRLVDPGNLVTANATTTLVVLAELQPITVIFTLAEDDLSQVLEQMRSGRTLPVEAYDRGQEKLLGTGKLITVDNQIDTTTGTVKLRAEFDNRDNALFPNQFVNTRLLVTTLDDQVLIPSSAIQHNGNVAFVYVLQNNRVFMRTVKPRDSENGDTSVEGLKPGDVVANSSFEKLQNGSLIFISKFPLSATNSETSRGNAP